MTGRMALLEEADFISDTYLHAALHYGALLCSEAKGRGPVVDDVTGGIIIAAQELEY